MLFNSVEDCCPVFFQVLTEIAEQNRELQLIKHLMPDIDLFAEAIGKLGNQPKERVLSWLSKLKVFNAYGTDQLTSLRCAYSADWLIYHYLKEVQTQKLDIRRWMQTHSDRASKKNMLAIKTADDCDMVEKCAKKLNIPEGFFPIREPGRDLMLEYFADEYGCAMEDKG